MIPLAYYSEWDKDAAAWLRDLIAAGLIMDGDVDERSISDVRPTDLAGYAQCHFFAGVSGWPLALQIAGWPDDQPVWSGSCPCQSFSTAGKRRGRYDPRHLWPKFCRLIAECQPPVVIGEQVASADTIGPASSKAGGGDYPQASTAWVDGVQASLEGAGYAFGFHVLGAHSVGAPHIRQRVYWLADRNSERCDRERVCLRQGQSRQAGAETSGGGAAIGLADSQRDGGRLDEPGRGQEERAVDGRACGMADAERADSRGGIAGEQGQSGSGGHALGAGGARLDPWSDFILIPCRDGKARRTQSGLSPLAHGVPRDVADLLPRLEKLGHDPKAAGRIIREARRHRVVALKGAGNAIVPPLAAEFIRAFIETEGADQ